MVKAKRGKENAVKSKQHDAVKSLKAAASKSKTKASMNAFNMAGGVKEPTASHGDLTSSSMSIPSHGDVTHSNVSFPSDTEEGPENIEASPIGLHHHQVAFVAQGEIGHPCIIYTTFHLPVLLQSHVAYAHVMWYMLMSCGTYSCHVVHAHVMCMLRCIGAV